MVAAPDPSRSLSVSAYHDEVGLAVAAMESELGAGADPATGLSVLDRALRGPAAAQVIDRLPYGRDNLMASARQELERPRPLTPSNPHRRADLVRILLMHQVDVLWWSRLVPYADEAAVRGASELRSLPDLAAAGALRFSYAVQPEGLVGRGRAYVTRRVAGGRRPRVSGLKFLAARVEIVAVLNEIADALRLKAPSGTPPLWVNSIVRTVEHQRHLTSLGYSALMPSSHCLGWGADVEMQWFEGFGAAEALQAILLDYRDRDVLNVIEEGQHWHLCLSPDHADAYRTLTSHPESGRHVPPPPTPV